jgi:molybdopterin molybdotransferase/putative molybdopterin biosynthesis protein
MKGPEIRNHLGRLRQARGLSAAGLAKAAGISRQTVYAMEAGSYVPNTAVALKLARALDASVEELFALPGGTAAPEHRAPQAMVLGTAPPGQPVRLCRVGRRMVASAAPPVPWYFPASDGIIAARPVRGKAAIQVFEEEEDFGNRLLVAGCDPAVSILARHVRPAGIELVLAHRNSSQALELLRQGRIHIAGTHLREEPSGEANLPAILRLFARSSVAVFSFAFWEEGIVTAAGNPKSIRTVHDLARQDVDIVNREDGSGSRLLLDSLLQHAGIPPRRVGGYSTEVQGHLPAAWRVHSGAADACIATRAAARAFGLGFIPLASERYDLAIHRQHLRWPAVQTLLDTLSRSAFRRELEGRGGYDAAPAGRRVL